MRHVSRTHRVALDRLFDRTNLDPKIPIKYIDTKNQRADKLTKRSFTRDEWKHLLCLFNISHFSSTVFQQDSREERVKAKSRPMMSLIARVPSNVSSSTSVCPGKRSYGNQDPWSTNAEKEERPVRPVVGSDRKTASDHYHEQFITSSSSANYSKWDDNHAWSSQEWKTDTEVCERSGRPDITSWRTTRESQPGVSHEETQHDGTAQSVVNEVIPRERIRESEKLKTVLELYDLETHQKKLGPDYHRLKTMVKRSIEQDIRNKNFGTRNGKLRGKRRGQKSRDKTAWTKNSWRILAMEIQRAVF